MLAQAAAAKEEEEAAKAKADQADREAQRKRFLDRKAEVTRSKTNALFEQTMAERGLSPSVQADARLDFESGLIGPDLAPTQKGQFEINLGSFPEEEPGDKEDIRTYFNRGFIDFDLKKTKRGELYFSDLDTVLHKGEQAFIEWAEMGAWDEHKERVGEDPFLKQVGTAVKSLVTEVIPEAATYGATAVWATDPFIAAADWIGSLGILPPFTKMHEARKDAKLSRAELQKLSQKEISAGIGAASRAAMENQAILDKGRQLLQAKAQAGATGAIAGLFDGGLGSADTAVLMALYDFENSKRVLREASADEAAAALYSLASLGASEAERMERAQFAYETSKAARAGRGEVELAAIDKEAASYGMIGADPSFLLTPAASLSAKGARTVGLKLGRPLHLPGPLGRTTLKATDDAAKHLGNLTDKRKALAAAAAREGAAPVIPGSAPGKPAGLAPGLKTTGKRAARRTKRQELFAKNLQRLDDEIYAAKRNLERHTARLGGVGGLVKDGVREVSKNLADRFRQTRFGSWATEVAIPTADDWLANIGRGKGTQFSGAVGSAMTGLGYFGLASGNPLGFLLVAPRTWSQQYRILRGATQMINAAGAEFFRRRVTMPYWQRVSERVAENPWSSNGALVLDGFGKVLTPITKSTGNVGSAIARSTAAEVPFSVMATGGEEGWFVEATAEAIAFSGPGQVQGIIHGLGGAPARMKKHEFDLLAQNDVAELRRNLSLGQRETFDGLDPVIKRQVGVYSALMPDVTFKFVPGSGGGAYHEKTKTLIIDPDSKNPLDVMLSHEIGHSLAARGMKEHIYRELIGPQGLLRDKDGSLTKEAGDFKKEYEARLNRGRPPKEPRLTLTDKRLAEEWFAEAVAPGLQKSQRLQQLVRRNKLITGLAESVLPRVPFGKAMLLRRGVLLDKNGNLAKGQGAMVSANLSPALARLADAYLRNNAGSKFIPAGKKVPGFETPVGGRTIEDLHRKAIYTREDMDRMEERNMIDYERNPDGSVKRDRFGRAKGLEPSVLAAQETAIGNIIRKVAERHGVEPLTQKRGGDRFDNLTREQWDEILEEIRQTGLYNDHQLAAMRSAFHGKADNDGKAHRFQYHKALDTNEKTGKKRYKPKPQEDRVGSIYSIEVTRQNNVIIKVIDMDALEERAVKASQSKDAPAMYRNNSADIMRDLMILAENHSKPGEPNVDMFGEERARFLNAVMGQLSKEHAFNNPKVTGGRPPIRSFRLDRANFVYNTNEDGLTFNHHQWLKGLMPEPADATTPQRDAQTEERRLPERGSTPEPAGERGDTTISRGASSQRAGEASLVLAGVQATAERHRFGFAVDVKSPEFYNDPGNTIYRSGDAGAAVTADGDLVSVYSVPGGEGNIDAVLTEASNDADTLDAFDIGGFLPNLYNRYGFRVVARVPFNREYAPPGWDYESAGEPDVVLAVKDPSAGPVDYNEARESVPAFAEWDDAEAHREKILSEIRESRGDDIRRMPDDPTALPIVEARNEDGSVKKNKNGKIIYESIDYDLLNAPALAALEAPPQDTTKPDYDSLHYHVTKKDRDRIDELIDNGSVDSAAADLESDARQAMLDAEIAAGIGWYSRMRKKLKIALAGDHQLFADLLGATSANTDVEQNFIYAFDAYRQFKTGKFNSMLKRFQEAADLAETGKLKETMIKRRIVGKREARRMDEQDLLKKWIERYNLEPRRADGQKYGMNSAHVFRALAGKFTKVRGRRAKDKLSPKTPQFSMNLFGSSLAATIDVWAARYLRRKLFAGRVKQWRIQPKSETGVSNGDFLLGQEIFRRAADRLGMNPDDLQALMWFKEKDVWDNADWTKGAGAIKTSFDQAADAFLPPKQTIATSQLAAANRKGLNSLNFIRKRRGVEGKAEKLEALAGQTGTKVTTAKRNLRNAKKALTKSRKRAGVAEFLERNPELN
jgi:hypothetical protein